jgi:hypothetical protein
MATLIEQNPIGRSASERLPIWMSALLSIGCYATGNNGQRTIAWNCGASQAHYTNGSSDTEVIYPFGIRLGCGETIYVSWLPGETEYSIELYCQHPIAA